MTACTLEENWRPYIIACLVTFFGGLIPLIPCHLVCRYCRDKRKAILNNCESTRSRASAIRTFAQSVLSGNCVFSKATLIVFSIIDIATIVVYLTEANMFDPERRDACGPVLSDPLQVFWVCLMTANALRFFIRFLAAHEKYVAWIDKYSIADHLTIVPTFVGAALNRNWLALRFLVVISILRIPDTLQTIRKFRDNNHIRIVKAVCTIFTVWLLGSGMIFILENNGDPFHDYENGQRLKFGECFYFILISLTTIGYGEIHPQTVLGRTLIVCLVVFALAVFTHQLPELSKMIRSRDRYRSGYKRSYNQSHVVICGGITFENVSTVVRNLINSTDAARNVDIVIVDIDKPSTELRAFFKRRLNCATYIRGSANDISTLQLAKAEQAAAVFILTNRQSSDADEEDSGNIVRAKAVKNLSSDIRIVIQLLRHRNKEHLLSIPGWNWLRGDEVICVSELQMAIAAQNCLAPGIVTMFSNLLCMHSSKLNFDESAKYPPWLKAYNDGASHGSYSQCLGKDSKLIGETFAEAAIFCFKTVDVLLVAIERKDGRSRPKLEVNPGQDFVLKRDDIVHFIAQDPNKLNSLAANVKSNTDASAASEKDHFCEPESAKLNTQNRGSVGEYADHVIFVLRRDDDASGDGVIRRSRDVDLRRFVSSLRSGSEHKSVVIYGDVGSYNTAQWREDLLNVDIRPRGSGDLHKDLRSLNVDKCAACIVTSVSTPSADTNNSAVVDKRTILTTLNILRLQKSMADFETSTVSANSESELNDEIPAIGDIPLLTLLESNASVHYVEDKDCDDSPSQPLHLTTPYACGRVLMASVLDSAVSTVFVNRNALRLIGALVTGESQNGTEQENTSPADNCHKRSSSLSLLSLQIHRDGTVYGDLVTHSLRSSGLLCLGIYRLIKENSNKQRRFVITNPPYTFKLRPSDKIYVLKLHNPRAEQNSCD